MSGVIDEGRSRTRLACPWPEMSERDPDESLATGLPVALDVDMAGTGDGDEDRLDAAQVRSLLDTAKAVPWEADARTGRFTHVAPQAAVLLGFPAERWYEADFWVEHLHPEDRDRAVEARQACATGTEAFAIEYRLIGADGRVVWVRDMWGSFLRNGLSGTLRGLLCDITDRKQRERSLEDALARIEALNERLRAENVLLRSDLHASGPADAPVGRSEAWRAVMTQAKRVAACDATVLLRGETGTGKEVVARAIHDLSPRRERPFVAVNCAALPDTLVESELFGHERGAFTGALTRKIGRFELADGGTILLDEIGDLTPDLQTKLLRVLQSHEFERLGSGKTTKVNVRVIAATHRDLERDMVEGRFRADLYYRLKVFPLRLPPLRERRDDIPLLVWYFVEKKGRAFGKRIEAIAPAAMEVFLRHAWPGNVRELENVIERAIILATGSSLGLDEVAFLAPDALAAGVPGATSDRLEAVERAHILRVLDATGWKVNGAGNAAARLAMNPSTLRSRMKKLGIRRPAGRPAPPRPEPATM